MILGDDERDGAERFRKDKQQTILFGFQLKHNEAKATKDASVDRRVRTNKE